MASRLCRGDGSQQDQAQAVRDQEALDQGGQHDHRSAEDGRQVGCRHFLADRVHVGTKQMMDFDVCIVLYVLN